MPYRKIGYVEQLYYIFKYSINRAFKRGKGKEQKMKTNNHGFEAKQKITIGGIEFTIIQAGKNHVKCISSKCIEQRAFDDKNRNDFAASDIRDYLNGEFHGRLIEAGAPEEMFELFEIDLTSDDGLKDYGKDHVRVGLITCDEYRRLREHIPPLPDEWWWTATPDSPINPYVRYVNSDGSLISNYADSGSSGVRPLCYLKSDILKSYIEKDGAKRAEAIDTMKHIAAAWGISAKEVFGE